MGKEGLVSDQIIARASKQKIRCIYFSTVDGGPGERASQPLNIHSVSMRHFHPALWQTGNNEAT